ncbi:hypothetical protein NVP1113A_60 [Vibrio phage 1.113.A._10N.286.51.E7]|nr:hypothetical protein NVP1113A_60 [Vibrio phage 1.113.A._10N.286.51.E7]
MKNADTPAMPQVVTEDSRGNGLVGSHMKEEWQGLTKREMFAMHALPSVIKWLDYGVERGEWDDWNFEDAASHAVIAADALLKELEK